jgi:hypothetical protein
VLDVSLDPTSPFPVDIAALIIEEPDRVRRYLHTYFDPDPAVGYTGRHFETFADRFDPYAFTPWDLIAVTALSVDVPPTAAAAILLPGSTHDTLNSLLREIPAPGAQLADTAAEHIAAGSPLDLLYRTVRDLAGLGKTMTSKLLAAKRPGLVPIRDSVVEHLLHAGDAWWAPMRLLIQDSRIRRLVVDASTGVVPTNISLLRRLDVVLWRWGKDVSAS